MRCNAAPFQKSDCHLTSCAWGRSSPREVYRNCIRIRHCTRACCRCRALAAVIGQASDVNNCCSMAQAIAHACFPIRVKPPSGAGRATAIGKALRSIPRMLPWKWRARHSLRVLRTRQRGQCARRRRSARGAMQSGSVQPLRHVSHRAVARTMLQCASGDQSWWLRDRAARQQGTTQHRRLEDGDEGDGMNGGRSSGANYVGARMQTRRRCCSSNSSSEKVPSCTAEHQPVEAGQQKAQK